ncbi:hypothetical protein [Bacteroides neonati]|uniref:hypothetical protein n=1 Tax=Bacteroides neonati TaxID=1347393 RepID=UPI0005A9BA13|nr:hypothetical protein [Bacteroides neonati]
MEGLLNFVSIIIIVFGVLQIILFFKLWGMTDDIRAIKNKYLNLSKNQDSNNVNPVLGSKDFQIGALVENVKTEKKLIIKEIKDGKYRCYDNSGIIFEGDFDDSEIRLLS